MIIFYVDNPQIFDVLAVVQHNNTSQKLRNLTNLFSESTILIGFSQGIFKKI